MGGREDFRSPRGASSRGVKALQISKKLSSGQKKTLERNEGLEGRNGRPSRSVGSSVPYPDLAQKVMRVETGRTRQSFPGDGRGLNHFQVAKRAGSGKKRRASSAGEDATRTPPTSHERPKRQKQHLSISARSEKLMEQPSADPMPSTSGRGQKITTANFYGASAGRNKRKATVPKRDETRSFQPARSFHRLRRRASTSDDEDDEDVNHGRNRRRERSRTAAKRSNPPPEPILIEVISDGEDEDENEDSRGNAGDASEPVTIASPGTRHSARIREKKGATGTAKLAAMIGKKNVNCMWRSKYTKGRSISISERDLDSLGDNEFLNDTVIDFYISHLLDKMQEETGSKTPGHGGRGAKRASVTSDDIFVFSTFFYRKLINSASSLDKLDKWCRDEDLFAKKYLFVPVCANYHWSLVLISNNLVYSVDNGNKLDDVATTIIHIDSMYAGHSTNNINKNLRKFLDHVWRRSTAIETSICHKVALESSMYERGEKAFNAATILGGRMKSPRQNNYSDCGLFLLKFLEKFLRRAPTAVHGTKVDHNGNKSLGGKFRVDHNGKDEKFGTRDWFRPGDAHELRKFLRHKIMNMVSHSIPSLSSSSSLSPLSPLPPPSLSLSLSVALSLSCLWSWWVDSCLTKPLHLCVCVFPRFDFRFWMSTRRRSGVWRERWHLMIRIRERGRAETKKKMEMSCRSPSPRTRRAKGRKRKRTRRGSSIKRKPKRQRKTWPRGNRK